MNSPFAPCPVPQNKLRSKGKRPCEEGHQQIAFTSMNRSTICSSSSSFTHTLLLRRPCPFKHFHRFEEIALYLLHRILRLIPRHIHCPESYRCSWIDSRTFSWSRRPPRRTERANEQSRPVIETAPVSRADYAAMAPQSHQLTFATLALYTSLWQSSRLGSLKAQAHVLS